MARYESEVELAAPMDEVFEVLVDIEGWGDWDPSIRTVLALDDGPPAAGSRHEVTVGFYGKAIEQVHEIIELEEPSRLVVETSGRASGRWTFDLSPARDGRFTQLRWNASLDLSGIARILDRGLRLAFNGIGDNAVEGLKRRFA